jgi:hypothetical protein
LYLVSQQAKTEAAKMTGETSNNSDAALARRHKQSAIIGRLTVVCFWRCAAGTLASTSGKSRKAVRVL